MTTTAAPAHLHDGYQTGARTMRVVEVRPLTDAITHFRFAPIDGTLTPYQPGSHLIVQAGATRNAYSLVDAGMYPDSYGISVLRKDTGGGSQWLHTNLVEGELVEIEGPRPMFAPVLDQHRALLVAGGIGITPILSHARAAAREGLPVEVVYSYRPGQGAHLDDLRALADLSDVTVYEATSVGETIELLTERLAAQPLGTHAYACGPAPLLDTYTRLASAAGWPAARVHLERFTAPEQDPGDPFTVSLADGTPIDVPPGVSLLERLLDNGVDVGNMCRQGVCGECRIPVRAGEITHRDYVLSDDEKAAGDAMLCCVSRGAGDLVLDVARPAPPS